jgi:hypothetical protein
MAMAMCRYVTARFPQWRRSRASLEATGRHHRASIMSDNINWTCLRRFCFDVFIVKTIGKGHGSTLRCLFLIRVWHIKQKRRAWLRWLYNLLGGIPERMTYARVVIVLCLYLLEQCLNPVLWTSIKARNFVTFYKFLIHLGMHHTLSHLFLGASCSYCLDIEVTHPCHNPALA